jgi:L-ascorbate metabolism protein UlaG (beta-lactamase superfamily)
VARSLTRNLVSWICSSLLLAASGASESRSATPIPRVVGPIPVNAESRPFMAAADSQTPLVLPAYGYTEEEYFVTGTAHVYDWETDGAVKVRTPDAPYTTRILIRRPIDPKQFSGTVWVDVLSPARGYDLAENWGYTNYYIMDHGDVSVGITSFPVTIRALRKFDAKRYATLSMANPEPSFSPCSQAGANYDYDMEPGLRWDMISQVGALLRSRSSSAPLALLKVERLFLYAQTGGDLPAYIGAMSQFAKLENGHSIWDGYFIKDSGGPSPLNQCGQRILAGDRRRIIRDIGVPVVRFLVEDMVLGVFDTRRPDSDTPGDQYRLYEVAGATHSDQSVFNWMPSLATLKVMNSEVVTPYWPFSFRCTPEVGLSDFPVHYMVSGAMHNLDEWVRTGTPPPVGKRIEVVNGGTLAAETVRDKFGNVVGGVRSPYVDVPAATYHENFPDCRNMGYKVPFDWSRMQSLYGNRETYQAKFNAATDRMVKERWVEAKYAVRMQTGKVNQPTTERMMKEDIIPASSGDLKLTTISHASLMFSYAGKVIYVDPVSTATDYSKLPKADLILVTHDHPDHLDRDAIAAVSTPKTTLVVSPICAKALPDARVLPNAQKGSFAGLEIEAVPAYNLIHKRPDGQPFHNKGDGDGFVVTFGDKRVYIAGDTENTPEMKSLKGIDIAFLPMNLPYAMTPDMVADAAKAFRPKILYPYHFSSTDPLLLLELLKQEKDIEVRIRDMR